MRLMSFTLTCTSVAFLAACGSALGPAASSQSAARPHVPRGSQTFAYTGYEQTFTVPSAVTRVTITATGASGGDGGTTSSGTGYGAPGLGGLVKAAIKVTPGETLAIYVGGTNGYNGGASGGSYGEYYGNGGGATDIRQGGTQNQDRVIVAGGGGGGGYIGYNMGIGGAGGNGGAKVAGAGTVGEGYYGGNGGGGGGGRQHVGGVGGAGGIYHGLVVFPPRCKDGCGYCNGRAGADGVIAGGGAGSTYCGGAGGGGGGGWWGGGGGGSGFYQYFGVSFSYGAGGGGGGGSSYVTKHAIRIENIRGGAAKGNGQVLITW